MRIVITGFMGSGKTSIARELASRLDLAFVDLDELITIRHKRSPAQLIVEEGEQEFRLVETLALRELVKVHNAVVIALGGGAWIEDANRALIRQYTYLSVWLDVPFEICWDRIVASGEDRPLGKTMAQAQALYDRRRPVYELAEIHISVMADESVDDVISRITDEIDIVRQKL